MEIKIFKTAAEATHFVAQEMHKTILEKAEASLGVATGRTMDAVYHSFVQLNKEHPLDFSKVKAFAVDEYIGLEKGSQNSYAYYLNLHLFERLKFLKKNTYVPEVHKRDIDKVCQDYEDNIAKAGGIDLQLLGIGRNGHIGLNEPGSASDSRTRVVALTTSTQNANKSLFKNEKIPLIAATIGIGTILDSKKCILIATGETKAEIIQRVVNGDVNSKLPATALKLHKNALLVLDKASAKLI